MQDDKNKAFSQDSSVSNAPEKSLPQSSNLFSDIEERKLRLEEQKFEEEKRLNFSKLDLEKRELEKTDPLTLAVVGGLIAALASVGVSYLNGQNLISAEASKHHLEMKTEAYKAEANRVLEAIKLGDPDRAACTLKFLINAELIQTESLKKYVDHYLTFRNGGVGVGVVDVAVTPGCQVTPNFEVNLKNSKISNINKSSLDAMPPPKSSTIDKSSMDAAPLEVFNYTTDWMSGGHNQNEACEKGMRSNQSRFPNKILRRVSSDEASKKDILGHVEYQYYCLIGVYESSSKN